MEGKKRSVPPRCLWSNRTGEGLKEITLPTMDRFAIRMREERVYVLPEHEAELRRFNDYANRWGRLFLGLMLLGTLGILVFALDDNDLGIGLSIVLLGVLGVVFPFATPETVQALGVRSAVRTTRILSAGVTVLGVLVAAGVL